MTGAMKISRAMPCTVSASMMSIHTSSARCQGTRSTSTASRSSDHCNASAAPASVGRPRLRSSAMILSRCSRLRFWPSFHFTLRARTVSVSARDFLERPAIHGVFGGHRRVPAVWLVVRHEPLLLRREHLGVIGDFRLALEDHRAVIGGREHRVGGVNPVRRDRAVHLIHLEGALRVREQIRELLVVAMQVDLDAVAEEQEGIEPDVRLPVGTRP